MMLFPYNREPDTGSRIPSISTGGAAMKAMMNTEVAVNRVGIIRIPNQPTYKRFSDSDGPIPNCKAPLCHRTATVPGGPQVDSLFRISHTDPWVGGDVHRTSRTVNFQVLIAALCHLEVLCAQDSCRCWHQSFDFKARSGCLPPCRTHGPAGMPFTGAPRMRQDSSEQLPRKPAATAGPTGTS